MNTGLSSFVLTTDNKEWDEIVNNSELSDIFHTRKYLQIFERYWGEKALLYVYGDEKKQIAYPFILRDISTLAFYDFEALGNIVYYDIISPWYYGGLIHQGNNVSDTLTIYRDFFNDFHLYCKEEKIVSEFGRLHPFSSDVKIFSEHRCLEQKGSVVYIDLGQSKEQIWQNMTRSNRKKINKSEKYGIEVRIDNTRNAIYTFVDLYLKLMERKNSQDFHKFSIGFFEKLFHQCAGSVELLVADYKGITIGGLILLGEGQFIHTYLSASHPEYLWLGPNNLLKFVGALRGKERGHRYFILGGGNSSDDSLFRFKKSFSGTVKDFYVYHAIHEKKVYDIMSSLNVAALRDHNAEFDQKSPFFPDYRR